MSFVNDVSGVPVGVSASTSGEFGVWARLVRAFEPHASLGFRVYLNPNGPCAQMVNTVPSSAYIGSTLTLKEPTVLGFLLMISL